jgi:hypothetical protein
VLVAQWASVLVGVRHRTDPLDASRPRNAIDYAKRSYGFAHILGRDAEVASCAIGKTIDR